MALIRSTSFSSRLPSVISPQPCHPPAHSPPAYPAGFSHLLDRRTTRKLGGKPGTCRVRILDNQPT